MLIIAFTILQVFGFCFFFLLMSDYISLFTIIYRILHHGEPNCVTRLSSHFTHLFLAQLLVIINFFIIPQMLPYHRFQSPLELCFSMLMLSPMVDRMPFPHNLMSVSAPSSTHCFPHRLSTKSLLTPLTF